MAEVDHRVKVKGIPSASNTPHSATDPATSGPRGMAASACLRDVPHSPPAIHMAIDRTQAAGATKFLFVLDYPLECGVG